jgi:hypothetical protein
VHVPPNLRSFTVAALWVCGCQKGTSPTVFVDPALATLVPANAVFVAGVRLQQLNRRPKLTVVDRFAHESGIEIGENLWEVLIAWDGKADWVMLRGKFSEMGMEPRVHKEGAERFRYKGYTILGDDRMAVLFLNPTTAVAAAPRALWRIIDNRDIGTGLPQPLQAHIKGIPSANQAWFAGKLREVGDIAGGIDFRSAINPRLTATASTHAEAERFAETLRRVFDGVQVEDKQIMLEIPVNRLDDLVALLSP